jgi:hypothetical protein
MHLKLKNMTPKQRTTIVRIIGNMVKVDNIIGKNLQQLVGNSSNLISMQHCSNTDVLFAVFNWQCCRFDVLRYYPYLCSKK